MYIALSALLSFMDAGFMHVLQVPKDCDAEYVAESPFLLSASSGAQVKRLESIDEAGGLLLHIEGPNRLWLRSVQTHYFSLKMSKQDSSDDPADEGTCEYRTVLVS